MQQTPIIPKGNVPLKFMEVSTHEFFSTLEKKKEEQNIKRVTYSALPYFPKDLIKAYLKVSYLL